MIFIEGTRWFDSYASLRDVFSRTVSELDPVLVSKVVRSAGCERIELTDGRTANFRVLTRWRNRG